MEVADIKTVMEGNVLYTIRSAGTDIILNKLYRRGYAGSGVRAESGDFNHLFVMISGIPENKNA